MNAPAVVILPTVESFPNGPVYQRFPSGPVTMSQAPSPGMLKAVTTPVGVTLAIWPPKSVTQTLPSGPGAMIADVEVARC